MLLPIFRARRSTILTILTLAAAGMPCLRSAQAFGPTCCGEAGTGPCNASDSGVPCCSDAGCCETVCAVDSYCCDQDWDATCVAEAAQICNCGPGDAPVNDDCSAAIAVGLDTVAISNLCATTAPPAHDTCTDDSANNLGLDVWYKYTASFTGSLTISTCDLLDPTWDSQLAVYEGCDCGALSDPPHGCNNDANLCDTGSSNVTVPVTFGTCYLIRVGSSVFGLTGNGGLLLSTNDVDCSLAIPGGAVAEADACGQNTNGGCNNLPGQPTFTNIGCGAVRRGTSWSDDVSSDSDWYAISLTQPAQATITLQSEFPGSFGVAQTNPSGSASCAAWTGSFVPSQTSLPCQLAYVQTTLPAGTSWIRVSNTGLDFAPCGGQFGNDYVLTLSCAGNCAADLNGDSAINAADLAQLLGAWGPQAGHPADLNNNGVVNAADLALLLGAWGPCVGSSGACCNADGAGTCLQMTSAACAAAGGLFRGNGSDCSECPPTVCITSTEDCCAFHASPGCGIVSCCESVCAAQPFCCNTLWDNACVQLAQQLCAACQ